MHVKTLFAVAAALTPFVEADALRKHVRHVRTMKDRLLRIVDENA